MPPKPPQCARRLLSVLAIFFFYTADARACPFCDVLEPTLSERREGADVCALAQLESHSGAPSAARIHAVLKGSERLTVNDSILLSGDGFSNDGANQPAGLVLLFGRGEASTPLAEFDWSRVEVNEFSFAYLARAPDLRAPAAERLAYFARYLEHADPLAAEDAYAEFGRAPYDVVRQAADHLSMSELRGWLVDPAIPARRKGFYGLALGLAVDEAERRANIALLADLAATPASDFRAGYDGLLAGYLLAAGEPALEWIETHLLPPADSADGDVRHALAALRFYQEFGEEIPQPRLHRAAALLLARPEFAAAVVTDLARWRCWEMLDEIAPLFDRYADDAVTRRAVVGYLLACPTEDGLRELARLRRLHADVVADAERRIALTGGVR